VSMLKTVVDADRDGLLDAAETGCTSPANPDTDGDGLCDGDTQVLNGATVVCVRGEDLDKDGVVDASETNPCLADTDGDLVSDYKEVVTKACMNERAVDTDGDGRADGAEDADRDGLLDAGETDPCLADTDADGLNDYAEVITYLTNPRLADSDADGLGDLLEALTRPCLDPLDTDTDNDGLLDGRTTGEDKDNDGNLDAGETDPCVADTDADGLGDGLEVITYTTNPRSWDTDGDALPDAYEVAHAGSAPPLNPKSAADGAGNFDGDANPNAHEYWNGSDPWVANPVGGVGCFYWADAGLGDGIVSPGDLTELKKVVSGTAGNYTGVIPNNGETHELDMDGVISPSDLTFLQKMIQGSAIGPLGSRPTALVTTESPGATVYVGFTTHVTVSVRNEATKGTPGFGVIFEIVPASSTATATLLGGDGSGGGSTRYDISGPITPGGLSRIVLRMNSIGTLTLRARIPLCGTPGIGRSCSEIILSPAAVIKAR